MTRPMTAKASLQTLRSLLTCGGAGASASPSSMGARIAVVRAWGSGCQVGPLVSDPWSRREVGGVPRAGFRGEPAGGDPGGEPTGRILAPWAAREFMEMAPAARVVLWVGGV
jgi:hypothetical protein